MDTQRQAKMYSLVAEMEAIKAHIEGMKALNQYRISRDETIAYDDNAFEQAHDQLVDIAEKLLEV